MTRPIRARSFHALRSRQRPSYHPTDALTPRGPVTVTVTYFSTFPARSERRRRLASHLPRLATSSSSLALHPRPRVHQSLRPDLTNSNRTVCPSEIRVFLPTKVRSQVHPVSCLCPSLSQIEMEGSRILSSGKADRLGDGEVLGDFSLFGIGWIGSTRRRRRQTGPLSRVATRGSCEQAKQEGPTSKGLVVRGSRLAPREDRRQGFRPLDVALRGNVRVPPV